jgi:hypothetical protein
MRLQSIEYWFAFKNTARHTFLKIETTCNFGTFFKPS